MIIVTGGAGFIGSNIIAGLNGRGYDNILVVDDLRDGRKVSNLADLNINDYLDREDLLAHVSAGKEFGCVEAVFHQGACSSTTEWDGQYIMRNNFEYSKVLLHWCQVHRIPFIYASSASVYGSGVHGFREERVCEAPLNMYAFSKFQFDQYVRRLLPKALSQIVGLRYFNVYGPREAHKGTMASTAWHFYNQIKEQGTARLFGGCDGYGDGEQLRDFVYVGDCVDLNLWLFDNPNHSGVFNCGTGSAQTFNDMARAVVEYIGYGKIEYIPFPQHLQGVYQSYTQADLNRLRRIGYAGDFKSVAAGIRAYLTCCEPTSTSGKGRHSPNRIRAD